MANSTVPALQRGIEIISKVCREGSAAPSDIESELKIPKASFGRLVNCLVENGFLEHGSDRKLHPGLALTEAVIRAHQDSPLYRATHTMLATLAETWRQTFVVYEYREAFKLIWRCKHEPSDGIPTQPPGMIIDRLNMNAQGQLFLSAMPDSKIREYMTSDMPHQATEFTIMDAPKMLVRAKEIRTKGYAFQERENHLSMKQLAVPLKLQGIGGNYALGCFLPVTFDQIDKLKDDMLYQAGLLAANY